MTGTEVIERLLGHAKFGDGIGFHRLQQVLQPLWDSDWGRQFTTIRITGSNGKGSVTALVHSLVRQFQPACGRYTSPHLIRFHERIVVGDREITDEELVEAWNWIERRVEQTGLTLSQFGSFELITVLCLYTFSRNGIVVGILEAGIGGRYDPTRLAPGETIALTSIDLEHTELLGATEELIAYDKLDLCPDGGFVAAVRRRPELWDRMQAYARLRRLTLINAAETWPATLVATHDASRRGMPVRVGRAGCGGTCQMPLLGTFQLDNLSVACAITEYWARRQAVEISDDQLWQALRRGIEQVQWPGRFEQIDDSPRVIVDVGHTPDACRRVIESVDRFLGGRPLLLVTGVSYNKSVARILDVLVPAADCVICTRAYHKGERVDRIAEVVRQIAPSREVFEAERIEDAAVLARQMASERGLTVLVAGGLFLAIEFRTAWTGGDPQQIRFY